MPHSGPHFLRFWCDLVSKSSILGSPWRPAGPKMAPKIVQVALKMVSENSRADYIAPTCFQDRFRSSPGRHLVDFGSTLAPKSKIFV